MANMNKMLILYYTGEEKMKKCCGISFGKCKGEIKRFEIYSNENHTYPNRYWGIDDYCEFHKSEDENEGFVFKEVGSNTQKVTL